MPEKTKREENGTAPEPTYQSPRVLLLAFGGLMLALILYGLLVR